MRLLCFYAFQFPIPPHHHSITLIVEYLGSFPSCSRLIAFDNAVDSDSQSCINFGVLQNMNMPDGALKFIPPLFLPCWLAVLEHGLEYGRGTQDTSYSSCPVQREFVTERAGSTRVCGRSILICAAPVPRCFCVLKPQHVADMISCGDGAVSSRLVSGHICGLGR